MPSPQPAPQGHQGQPSRPGTPKPSQLGRFWASPPRDVQESIATTIPIGVVPAMGSLDGLPVDAGKGQTYAGESHRSKPLGGLLSRINLTKNSALLSESSPEPVVPVKRSWSDFFRIVGRRAVPIVDIASPLLEGIPVVGAPIKGALDTLVKIQKIFEARCQNKEDVEKLVQKLQNLKKHFENNTSSENIGWLLKRLGEVESEIDQLSDKNVLEYETVAGVITQCDGDITFFLAQASVSGHSETQALLSEGNDHIKAELAAVRAQLVQHQDAVLRDGERQGELAANLDRTMALFMEGMTTLQKGPVSAVLKVVDPFGIQHTFSQIPSTYADFGRMILEKAASSLNPDMQKVLSRLVNANLFELSIDDGREVTPLGKQALSSLNTDVKVVVSAIMFSVRRSGRVRCPRCKGLIRVGDRNADIVLCESENCSGRNVQASTDDASSDASSRNWQASESITSAERALLYQFVVKTEDRTLRIHTQVDGDDDGVIDYFFGGTYPNDSVKTFVNVQNGSGEDLSRYSVASDWDVEVCNVYNMIEGDYRGVMGHHGKIDAYNCYNVISGNMTGVIQADGGVGTYTYYNTIHGDHRGFLDHHAPSVIGSNIISHTTVEGVDSGIRNFTSHGPGIPTRDGTTIRLPDIAAPDPWGVSSNEIFRTITGDCKSTSRYYGNVRTYNVFNDIAGDFGGVINHHHHHHQIQTPTSSNSYRPGIRGPQPWNQHRQQSRDDDTDEWVGTYNIYNTISGDFNGVVDYFGNVETFNVYNTISGDFSGVLGHNHHWDGSFDSGPHPYQYHSMAPEGPTFETEESPSFDEVYMDDPELDLTPPPSGGHNPPHGGSQPHTAPRPLPHAEPPHRRWGSPNSARHPVESDDDSV